MATSEQINNALTGYLMLARVKVQKERRTGRQPTPVRAVWLWDEHPPNCPRIDDSPEGNILRSDTHPNVFMRLYSGAHLVTVDPITRLTLAEGTPDHWFGFGLITHFADPYTGDPDLNAAYHPDRAAIPSVADRLMVIVYDRNKTTHIIGCNPNGTIDPDMVVNDDRVLAVQTIGSFVADALDARRKEA